MHELSIVMGIVDLATNQALLNGANSIEEIELEIGCLSGVEMDSFEFAWKQGIRNSMLENSIRHIHRPEGKALCGDCNTVFHMQQLFDACPNCNGHLLSIIRGKELKVKSLVLPEST
ncbi:MAG: hydrogenase expression protein [Bacteroidetes bacterium 24-39-8]|jgi:hydrogenase nickel incorporation protein HypA/HybF|nr:MAG: hydrogenase expression protein [Sphingobacteriia bacterium 35-40-8]OYZ51910.1 MAG: hydrogenase expression protein [Bacteroidetes bacterium 24-39-8]OZA64072.1 MAG: hydrogenase expression protein [Sphingobacteriia bacterium 39-39-8]HQR94273.1 hydrogenase maturation nickel metallochaperone HypA [Sediminibacterium sp.]HQS55154.1 hydrogenase maturation nickel metallochaperone HypA [Sediminibacterium sp.]